MPSKKEFDEMPIQVKVPTQLRSLTGGRGEVEVAGATVGEALLDLEAIHPGISERILDESGAVRRFVNIYLGAESVRFLDGLDTHVSEGDVLSIIPAVAGGCRGR